MTKIAKEKIYNEDFVELLPEGHWEAISHPILEYDNYYEYQESFSNYHFDKWSNDSLKDLVDLSLQFRGEAMNNIMNEVLPYQREKSKVLPKNSAKAASLAAWYHQNEIPNMSHSGYKERVKPDKHPTLQKIVDWFEFEDDQSPIILEKNIGDYQQWHVDCHAPTNLIRVLIHLQDWEFGQVLLWGTQPMVQWRAGDAIMWDPNIPHATANASRSKRYTLRVTGTPSANTIAKLKQGGIVNVDQL